MSKSESSNTKKIKSFKKQIEKMDETKFNLIEEKLFWKYKYLDLVNLLRKESKLTKFQKDRNDTRKLENYSLDELKNHIDSIKLNSNNNLIDDIDNLLSKYK